MVQESAYLMLTWQCDFYLFRITLCRLSYDKISVPWLIKVIDTICTKIALVKEMRPMIIY